MPTDWQPHEQLSGGSSPPVREMMDDAIHRARADAAGVDADKLVDERIAELEAALEQERDALIELAYYLGADCEAPPPDGGPNYNTFADGWVLWARARVRREQRGVRRRAKAKRARARAREEAGGA